MRILLLIAMALVALDTFAQNDKQRQDIDFDSPTFVPTVKVGKVLENGDSIQYMEMNNVYVYPPITFSSKKQQQAYTRLVKNVKIVLPIAKGGSCHHDGNGGVPGNIAGPKGKGCPHETGGA